MGCHSSKPYPTVEAALQSLDMSLHELSPGEVVVTEEQDQFVRAIDTFYGDFNYAFINTERKLNTLNRYVLQKTPSPFFSEQLFQGSPTTANGGARGGGGYTSGAK